MKANTFYFSHDFTARSDEKIKRLLMKFGMEGYGIYWAIIEDLYQNANALQADCERIAFELRTHSETIRSILYDFDLFVFTNDNFGSLSIQKRMDARNEKSKSAQRSAFYRWNNANAMRTHNETDANAMQGGCERNAIKERKGKESKRKEIKENKIKKNQVKKSASTSNPAAQGEYVGQEFNLMHETSDLAHDNGANNTNIPTEQISFVKTQKNGEGDLRKKFIEIYDTWMKSRNMPVRIDAGDASAVKKVISYIQKLDSVQNGIKQPAEVWQFIFDQWENLTTWQQTQTQLKQINSQLPNFIETLKQAHNGKQKHSKNSNELQSLASALRNSIAGSQSLQ